jgi:hypothetical protein
MITVVIDLSDTETITTKQLETELANRYKKYLDGLTDQELRQENQRQYELCLNFISKVQK